jgi:hypothetical protein
LNPETEVPIGEDFDSNSKTKGKTLTAAADARNVGGAYAANYEGSHPLPVFKGILVGEVSVELVQNCPLLGRGLRCIFQMEVRVLPCPAELNQIFLVESYTEGQSVGRIRIENNPSVGPFDFRLKLES